MGVYNVPNLGFVDDNEPELAMCVINTINRSNLYLYLKLVTNNFIIDTIGIIN